ncbi:unnamed protein product [Urochloa humidicola]
MSRLQRSSVSFRRQGSSGRIWDDPLRGLDLKSLSTPRAAAGAAAVAAPMHPDASIVLAGDPSPRVVSRSLVRRGIGGGGGGISAAAGVIVESPDAAAAASPATVVVGADDGERPARRRRRISAAFCACMGHPPASHAQQ